MLRSSGPHAAQTKRRRARSRSTHSALVSASHPSRGSSGPRRHRRQRYPTGVRSVFSYSTSMRSGKRIWRDYSNGGYRYTRRTHRGARCNCGVAVRATDSPGGADSERANETTWFRSTRTRSAFTDRQARRGQPSTLPEHPTLMASEVTTETLRKWNRASVTTLAG